MPHNKKHHFVPRFYLKRFSSDGKSISLYNIPSKKKIPSGNLGNQCYRDYFYGKNPAVEKSLSTIEASASAILNRLSNEPYSVEDHLRLILYLTLQRLRTAAAVEATNEIAEKFLKHIGKQKFEEIGANPDDFSITVPWASEYAVATAMLGHYLLLDLSMKVIELDARQFFITSDAPVVFHNQLFQDDRLGSNEGVTSKGLMVFFPIDPSRMIFLYDSDVYAVTGRKSDTLTSLSDFDVEQINALQLISAGENIYFRDKDFPAARLNSKYSRHRRGEKMSLSVHPGRIWKDGYSEFVAASKRDTKLNLQLSFVRVMKSVRLWKAQLNRLDVRPAVVERNERLSLAHQRFVDLVRQKHVEPHAFIRWHLENYGSLPFGSKRNRA